MNDVTGFDELEEVLAEMAYKLDEGIAQVLEDTATEIIGETQSRTPVKTGNLRRSWTHGEIQSNGKEKSIQLGSSLVYAQAIEEGHKQGSGFVEGKHMLKDSITIGQKELNEKVNNMVGKLFGGR